MSMELGEAERTWLTAGLILAEANKNLNILDVEIADPNAPSLR